jgi:hypothetical protein
MSKIELASDTVPYHMKSQQQYKNEKPNGGLTYVSIVLFKWCTYKGTVKREQRIDRLPFEKRARYTSD